MLKKIRIKEKVTERRIKIYARGVKFVKNHLENVLQIQISVKEERLQNFLVTQIHQSYAIVVLKVCLYIYIFDKELNSIQQIFLPPVEAEIFHMEYFRNI